MKTLYILRHAKSSWDNATLSDFERPLNARGQKAAPFIGSLMKERGFIPDVIVASPATRAKQTAKLVRKAADIEPQITFYERIYEANVGTLVSVLSEIDDHNNSALIVGHNPGAEGLIYFLTGKIVPMPTAALATIELDIDMWAGIDAGCGRLKDIIRPRDQMPAR